MKEHTARRLIAIGTALAIASPAMAETDLEKRFMAAMRQSAVEYCHWQRRQSSKDCVKHEVDAIQRIAIMLLEKRKSPDDKGPGLLLFDCWQQHRIDGFEYAVDWAEVEECMR